MRLTKFVNGQTQELMAILLLQRCHAWQPQILETLSLR